MARKPRIQFEGAFYHIIVRGNQRQDIFLDDADYREYLQRLGRYKSKCGFRLYAYVLMTNHVHLVIETPGEPISRIMQMINFTYTQYFNRKYRKVGHLFQGRYKSYLCDKDNYLLSLLRYIHNNPVRADMVKNVADYQWSSHDEYLSGTKGMVDSDSVLRMFSESRRAARRKYQEFMAIEETHDTFSPYAAYEQQIVGDDRFIAEIGKRMDTEGEKPKKTPLNTIARIIEQETGVDLSELESRRREAKAKIARGVFVAMAKEMGYRLSELQEVLKRDLSVVSRLASVGESASAMKTMKAVKRRLKANSQA